jgi:chemotaxis methyl-accepting protein methylase
MEQVLKSIVLLMKDEYEMNISGYETGFLKQAIEKRCLVSGVPSVTEYLIFLLKDEDEARQLFTSLNITYTEFFRNTLTFAHIAHLVLPDILRRKSKVTELRIWSAGCSSGQEAYSLAIQVENQLERLSEKIRYRIIATDISEPALATARQGFYNKEAIGNVKAKDLDRYFVRNGEKYGIDERLKKNVSFSYYDLLDRQSSFPQESIFGNFDLVMCSNLLFYYKEEHQKEILNKLVNALAPRGYLISGETEKPAVSKVNGLHMLVPTSPIFRKTNGGPRENEKSLVI